MLSFANAPGNLYNRLGKIALLIKQQKTYQTAQLANMIDTTNGVVAQLNSEPDIQAIQGSSYISLLNSGASSIGSTAQTLAAAVLNRMIFRDNPQLNQTLTSSNLQASLLELIRQMKVAGASVRAMSVTATKSAQSGAGDGTITTSVRRPLDGKVMENSFGETVKFQCTDDSYTGGATQGNEGFTYTGAGSQDSVFAFDWPLGSNCNGGFSAIDGSVDVGSGNFLTNSSFEEFTDNVPDNWTLDVGTAGTTILENTTIVYDGSAALELVGDAGGTLTQISQGFDDETSASLSPQTQYSCNFWIRRDGTAAATGILTVELQDGSGAVIQDENGVDNSFTVDLTSLNTVYTAYNGVFRTPHVLPDEIRLVVRISTALEDGRAVYLDRLSLGQMTQFYVSGPFAAIHSGAIPFEVDDYLSILVTNSRGAAGTLSTWQTVMSQFFGDMIGSELLLPSSNTPTISDSALIA